MPVIHEITDLTAPELDIYARLTQAQLRNRLEPEKGIFIAESPKVIARALDAGYQPLSLLMERKQITGPAAGILSRCGDAPVYTADRETLASLTKQRTILNVRKKRRQKLYTALADVEALAPSKALYEEGLTGMEAEFERYMEAVALLESSGVPRKRLTEEKAEIYEQLAELNREIRTERQKLKLCHEIQNQVPVMEQDIQRTEEHQKEVREHEHRRR